MAESTSSTVSASVVAQNEYRKRIENDQEMQVIGEIEEAEMYKLMRSLEDFLDEALGTTWWAFYVAAAFWSNISTPINLAITLLSAITAGQAASAGGNQFISPSLFAKISISSLLLSTLNTFFRPQNKYMEIMTIMKSLNLIAFEFEEVYYTRNLITRDFKRRYEAYKLLKIKYNKFINDITPEQQSFVTDLLFYMVKNCCLKKKNGNWLELSKDEKESIGSHYTEMMSKRTGASILPPSRPSTPPPHMMRFIRPTAIRRELDPTPPSSEYGTPHAELEEEKEHKRGPDQV